VFSPELLLELSLSFFLSFLEERLLLELSLIILLVLLLRFLKFDLGSFLFESLF